MVKLMTLGVRFQISADPKYQNPEPETWNLHTYLVAAEEPALEAYAANGGSIEEGTNGACTSK